jgi:hypothetical protein
MIPSRWYAEETGAMDAGAVQSGQRPLPTASFSSNEDATVSVARRCQRCSSLRAISSGQVSTTVSSLICGGSTRALCDRRLSETADDSVRWGVSRRIASLFCASAAFQFRGSRELMPPSPIRARRFAPALAPSSSASGSGTSRAFDHLEIKPADGWNGSAGQDLLR